jgi:hypothetical protein
MNSTRIQIAPEVVVKAKHLFEETSTPSQDIAAMMGISLDTLRRRGREWGWQRHSRLPATRESPGSLSRVSESIAAARRRAVASRIMTILEDELARIENMFRDIGASTEGAFDNRMRALLGVTKTLREVELMSRSNEVIPPDAADNDSTRDIHEFREALARRIESFVAAQQNANGGTDDGAAR